MKTVELEKHGNPDVLKIKEVDKPFPKDNEILIKIKATSVTSGDVALRKQSLVKFLLLWPIARILFGIKNQRKKILGHEFSGIVELTGKNVVKFSKGDSVFGTTGFKGGAYAEYICLNQNNVISTKPDNLNFQEAAVIPIGGICSLDLLQKARIKKGDKVLIYGASGSIGTYAVQIAKFFDSHVTGVCSTTNIELVFSLGADKVIDYKKEDICKTDIKYDIVFDTVGKFTKTMAKRILSKNGRYISTHSSPVKEKNEYLVFLKEMIKMNKVKPIIDKTYSLQQVSEAHKYVDTGRKKGNVVILVEE
jgi:NADPH:quinone reductase-like Zn-dependent oxidoreductase